MNPAVNKVNQKVARKIYINFLIKTLITPIIISIAYLLCSLVISKYFFIQMPTWYLIVLILPIAILFGFTLLRSRKLFFSQHELSAYIDFKTSSEGMYLTAFELDAKLGDQIQKELLYKTSNNLNILTPWRFILTYICLFVLFILVVQFLPSSFLKLNRDAGELLAIEKSALADLINAKVIDLEIAKELQKELDKLKEDFKENGITKENWEKKQSIGQILDEKLLEQQKIQEKLLEQMEQLEKKLNSSEKMEEIAKAIHSLENSLALNEFAKQSEEFKKSEIGLQDFLTGSKDKLNSSKLDLNQKLKLLESLKKMNKEMQMQQSSRKDCSICQSDGQMENGKTAESSLASKLAELADRLNKEAKECQSCIESGIDAIAEYGTEGGGTSEIKFTNQANPELTPLNLEKFNKGGQFNSEGQLVDVSESKHDKYTLDNQKNDKRNFQNTGTDIVNEQKVIPNRREVIKKYFKRESIKEK